MIDHYMIDKDILLNYKNNSATIYFDQAVYLPNNNVGAKRLLDEVINISEIIISIISLLDYLRYNNYLKLIQGAPNPTPPRFRKLSNENKIIKMDNRLINDSLTHSKTDNLYKVKIINDFTKDTLKVKILK